MSGKSAIPFISAPAPPYPASYRRVVGVGSPIGLSSTQQAQCWLHFKSIARRSRSVGLPLTLAISSSQHRCFGVEHRSTASTSRGIDFEWNGADKAIKYQGKMR